MSYKQLMALAQKENIPTNATLEITYRCHLKCTFCYVEDRDFSTKAGTCGEHVIQIQTGKTVKETKPEMNLQEYKTLLDQLAKAGTLTIVLTGGEMMVKKEWLDIAKYARKKDFELILFTTGTLINERIADEIKKLNPRSVELSLHGADAFTNDKIMRVPGSFEKIIRATRMLVKRNIKVKLKSVITKDNYLQTSAMDQLAKSLGAIYQASADVNPRADFGKDPLNDRLNAKQFEVFYDQYLENETLDDLTEMTSVNGQREKVIPCSVGSTMVAFNPFAEVITCVVLRKKIGDLREQSFNEIWQNSVQLKKIREFREQKMPGDCPTCEFSQSCARCPGATLSETGSLTDAPDHYFKMAQAEHNSVQKAFERERKKLKKGSNLIMIRGIKAWKKNIQSQK